MKLDWGVGRALFYFPDGFTGLPFFAPLYLEALGIPGVVNGLGVSMIEIYCRDKRILFDTRDSDYVF